MKKKQVMALTCSMFFFNLLTFSARGQQKVNCGQYSVVYATDNRKNEFKLCLYKTQYNQHGTIYLVGIPNSELTTIYKGKNGDAIVKLIISPWEKQTEYGFWKRTGQYYLFQFPSKGKIYIPIS